MAWFARHERAGGEPDDGEELEGLLASDGAPGDGDAGDAHNPRPRPAHPSRRRGEIKDRAEHVRAEFATAIQRDVLGHLETIDWSLSRVEARRHEEVLEARLRSWPALLRGACRAYDAGQSWVALGVIGASCGVVASIIDTGTDWATDVKFGLCSRGFWISKATCCSDATDTVLCPAWNAWAPPGFFSFVCYVLVAMAMGSYSAWISQLYPFACGSGLPEIKVVMGGFVMHRLLGLGTLLSKSMGLVLAVGAGLSIGKEGPFVHVAMCVAHAWSGVFSKYAHNQGRNRELLASAAAAGVAVAFGAPVGGVLFSLEEVSSYFPPKTMWRAFWCAIVAVLTMQHLNHSGVGKLAMFEVHYHHQWKHFEMLPFLALGVVGGLLGAAFNTLHRRLLRWRQTAQLGQSPVTEAALLSVLTAMLQYQAVYLRSSATGLLAALFSESCAHAHQAASGPSVAQAPVGRAAPDVSGALCQDELSVILELLICAVIKVPLTLWASTAPVPGGILIPSLVMGGLLGRASGLALQLLQASLGDAGIFEDCRKSTECITPGVYAMVGAAAVLSGVTRSTVSLVVIMLEITGGLEYVLPIMTSVMVSKWVGDVVGGRETIYDNVIKIRGYPHMDHKLEPPRNGGCARDVLLFLSQLDVSASGAGLQVRQSMEVSCSASARLAPAASAPVRGSDAQVDDSNIDGGGDTMGEEGGKDAAGGSRGCERKVHVLEMHGSTRSALRQLLELDAQCSGFPVVVSHAHPVVVGFVSRRSLLELLKDDAGGGGARGVGVHHSAVGGEREDAEMDVMRVARVAPLQVDEDTPIDTLMDMFVGLGLRFVLVSSRALLTGIITKKDLLLYLNRLS